MRIWLSLVLFLVSCGTASAASFFPENDLWKYDCIDCERTNGMTEEIFNKIADAGVEAFAEEAKANNEIIQINKKWADSTVNANVRRFNGIKVEINMFGGLARHQLVNLSSFAIVLCHELGGHAYGGAPYVYPEGKLAAEGQSDYMATKDCYERVFNLVPELQAEQEKYEDYIEAECDTVVCKNALHGSKGLAWLLSDLMGEPKLPAFETPDQYKAPKTMLSYPKTAQCRLDSYVAGVFKWDRPACWFKN